MRTKPKPPLVVIGGIAQSGIDLLRGLLDGARTLAVPPVDDFFVRTLTRNKTNLWNAWSCSRRNVVDFYRRMQYDGHFERSNAVHTEHFPRGPNLLDLGAYYAAVCGEFRRFSLYHTCEAHFLGLRAALYSARGCSEPIRVSSSVLVPEQGDFFNACWLLTKYYDVQAVIIYRHPATTYLSGHRRAYFGGVEPFLRSIDQFSQQVSEATRRYRIRLLTTSFEKLLTETEHSMRRVSEFLQIPFDPFLLAYTQNGVAKENDSTLETGWSIDPASELSWADVGEGCSLMRHELDLLNRIAPKYVDAMQRLSS